MDMNAFFEETAEQFLKSLVSGESYGSDLVGSSVFPFCLGPQGGRHRPSEATSLGEATRPSEARFSSLQWGVASIRFLLFWGSSDPE